MPKSRPTIDSKDSSLGEALNPKATQKAATSVPGRSRIAGRLGAAIGLSTMLTAGVAAADQYDAGNQVVSNLVSPNPWDPQIAQINRNGQQLEAYMLSNGVVNRAPMQSFDTANPTLNNAVPLVIANQGLQGKKIGDFVICNDGNAYANIGGLLKKAPWSGNDISSPWISVDSVNIGGGVTGVACNPTGDKLVVVGQFFSPYGEAYIFDTATLDGHNFTAADAINCHGPLGAAEDTNQFSFDLTGQSIFVSGDKIFNGNQLGGQTSLVTYPWNGNNCVPPSTPMGSPIDNTGTYQSKVIADTQGAFVNTDIGPYYFPNSQAANAAPSITNLQVAPASVTEGGNVTVSFDYSDADQGDTGTATVTVGGVQKVVNIAQPGPQSVQFAIADDVGPGPSNTVSVTVDAVDAANAAALQASTTLTEINADPTLTNLTADQVVLGNATNITADINDIGALDLLSLTGTVDYGEGNGPAPLSIASGSITLNFKHTYQTAGTFQLTLTLTDKDEGSVSKTISVKVDSSSTGAGGGGQGGAGGGLPAVDCPDGHFMNAAGNAVQDGTIVDCGTDGEGKEYVKVLMVPGTQFDVNGNHYVDLSGSVFSTYTLPNTLTYDSQTPEWKVTSTHDEGLTADQKAVEGVNGEDSVAEGTIRTTERIVVNGVPYTGWTTEDDGNTATQHVQRLYAAGSSNPEGFDMGNGAGKGGLGEGDTAWKREGGTTFESQDPRNATVVPTPSDKPKEEGGCGIVLNQTERDGNGTLLLGGALGLIAAMRRRMRGQNQAA